MAKEINKILKKSTKEVKKHIDVLKEGFDSKVQLIAKHYDSFIEKLDRHGARLASVEKNIEIMKVILALSNPR